MDIIITFWQEIISLMIVFGTLIVLVRSLINKSRYKKDCSTCALVDIQSKKRSGAQQK